MTFPDAGREKSKEFILTCGGGEELPAVLDCYRQILEPIRAKAEKTWYADYCFGVLKDIDEDGYPELLLLYSPDGNELKAVIATRTGKGVE